MEPVFLRVPPDSLQDLAAFGKNLEAQNWPYMSFITRITFDPEKSHPKFVFNFNKALTNEDAPTIFALREDPLSKRITGEDEIARRAALSAPATPQGTLPPPERGSGGGFHSRDTPVVAAAGRLLMLSRAADTARLAGFNRPMETPLPPTAGGPVLDAALGQGGSFNVAVLPPR